METANVKLCECNCGMPAPEGVTMNAKHEEFDPITMTNDGRVVWRRYDGGDGVVTEPGESPEQAPDGDELRRMAGL
jgi:hypothetical protein